MGIDFLIGHHLFGRVDEKDVSAAFGRNEAVFKPAPRFADASFQEVALDGSLEQFLGNGNQNAVECFAVVCQMDIAKRTGTAMPASGKKSFDGFLAAQSFLFRKSIRSLPVHFDVSFI